MNPEYLQDAEKPYTVIIYVSNTDYFTVPFDKDYVVPSRERKFVPDTGYTITAEIAAKDYATDVRKNGAAVEEETLHIPISQIRAIRVKPA